MSLTYQEARDEILELITKALSEYDDDLIIHYWDRPQDPPADGPEGPPPWVRVTVRHNVGRQATIGTRKAGRRFERRGVLTVEIFSPSGTGLSIGDVLYKVASDALEGNETCSGLWFNNVRLNEVGQDGAWFKSNVLADFVYDEVK